MEVTIQDPQADLYLAPYKITREQVIDTINNADFKKTIQQEDYTITLYLRKFDNYYILVDGRPKPSSILFSGAF